MHNFKELNIWKDSKEFSLKVYKEVSKFPSSEMFGITSQIKRCVISIPSNIAEGAGRNSKKDFSRFISIAIGSSFELETQLIIAKDLKFIDEPSFVKLNDRLSKIQKMLIKFKKYLDSKIN